jgi:hypothetical protein
LDGKPLSDFVEDLWILSWENPHFCHVHKEELQNWGMLQHSAFHGWDRMRLLIYTCI